MPLSANWVNITLCLDWVNIASSASSSVDITLRLLQVGSHIVGSIGSSNTCAIGSTGSSVVGLVGSAGSIVGGSRGG